MKKAALFIIPVIFLFNTCALEIANVIGPGGGWVFYDKGNYRDGWRYMECSASDFGELKNGQAASIMGARKMCDDHSGGHIIFPWELPDEAQLKKMLECFSYGLTNFSPDVYYLSLNIKNKERYNDIKVNDESTWQEDEIVKDIWDVVILHKNFNKELNGKVEKVDFPGIVKIRPVRKF